MIPRFHPKDQSNPISFLLFQSSILRFAQDRSAIGNSLAGLLGRRGFFENFIVRFDHSSSPPYFDLEQIPAFKRLQRVARIRGETLFPRKKQPQTSNGVKPAPFSPRT